MSESNSWCESPLSLVVKTVRIPDLLRGAPYGFGWDPMKGAHESRTTLSLGFAVIH